MNYKFGMSGWKVFDEVDDELYGINYKENGFSKELSEVFDNKFTENVRTLTNLDIDEFLGNTYLIFDNIINTWEISL